MADDRIQLAAHSSGNVRVVFIGQCHRNRKMLKVGGGGTLDIIVRKAQANIFATVSAEVILDNTLSSLIDVTNCVYILLSLYDLC